MFCFFLYWAGGGGHRSKPEKEVTLEDVVSILQGIQGPGAGSGRACGQVICLNTPLAGPRLGILKFSRNHSCFFRVYKFLIKMHHFDEVAVLYGMK